jgi:predicted nuclease of predicted toxin-antitoxin system
VKLLLDENLSRRVLRSLVELFPGSSHAKLEALQQVPDELVWDYAQSNNFCLVSADSDFFEMATALGPPAKLIWLRGCKYPALEAEELLRSHADRIAEFLDDSELVVLILTPR